MNNLGILGLISILFLVIAISGCTSSNNVNPQTDIIIDGNPNGQWNNAQQSEWLYNGNLKSISNTSYSQVTIKLTAYNSQNQTVGETTTSTSMNNGYGSFSAIIPVTSQPDHVNMAVINATAISNTASDVDTHKTKTKRK